jgi:hypothetical protein
VHIAIGLKARTGRAVFVAVGASPRLQVLQRGGIRLLPEGDLAPYHAASELPSAEARDSVAKSIAAAHRLAAQGLGDAIAALTRAGHRVCACGVLVGARMPPWSIDEILAVHVRMHEAEGALFRETLVAAVDACALPLTPLPGKNAIETAASMLDVSRPAFDSMISALGREVGAPWVKDHKEAAAAAIVALAAVDANARRCVRPEA